MWADGQYKNILKYRWEPVFISILTGDGQIMRPYCMLRNRHNYQATLVTRGCWRDSREKWCFLPMVLSVGMYFCFRGRFLVSPFHPFGRIMW